MFKKLFLTLSFLSLLVFCPNAPQTKANPALALGIIGTALGGSALGLGLLNSYQGYRNNGWYGGRYRYPVSYGGYYPAVNTVGFGGGFDPCCNAGYGYGGGFNNVGYGGYGGGFGNVAYGGGCGAYGGYGGYATPRYYGAFGGYGGYNYY
jgi:hypothetical protein